MGSEEPAVVVCQECGGPVLIEVSWDAQGVDEVYFECEGCGKLGRTSPSSIISGYQPNGGRNE